MSPIQGNKNEHGRNSSGYSDPTMTEAVDKATKNRKRKEKLVKTIYYICEMAGFEVGERIVLVDKTTGKIWR